MVVLPSSPVVHGHAKLSLLGQLAIVSKERKVLARHFGMVYESNRWPIRDSFCSQRQDLLGDEGVGDNYQILAKQRDLIEGSQTVCPGLEGPVYAGGVHCPHRAKPREA